MNEPRQTNIASIVDLHIAEYQALTNRSTYLIFIASSIWPILIVFLTVIAPIWPNIPRAISLWSMCFVGQFALFCWAENSWQQMNNIKYIERHLRPLISDLVCCENFWLYEKYLGDQRKKSALWWEAPIPWAAAVLALSTTSSRVYSGIVVHHLYPNFWELAAFFSNLLLLWMVISKAHKVVELRLSLFSPRTIKEPDAG